MLMAKQSKNSPQLNKLPKKQSIAPSNLVSNVRVRSKPPPLFPSMPPPAARKPSEQGVKQESKSSSSALTKNNDCGLRRLVQPPGTGDAKYIPTMCDLDRIINGVLKTDLNKGWLHNITCMDEYSSKSPEELRWEEYCKLWRYSEPLKPLLDLDQKSEEKSSILDAGRRTSSSVNKDDNQAAAINGKANGGLDLGRPEIAVGELSNDVTVQRRDPERDLVDLRGNSGDGEEQNIGGERLPITVNGRLVCGEEDELCGHRTSGDSDIISIRPRLKTRIAKRSH